MKVKVFWFLLAAMLVFLPVEYCKGADSSSDSKSLKQVYVVNYPLKYFTERIAQEKVAVLFPAPSDEDPAFWMPDAQIISAYQKAELIVLNGAHYAKWIEKVTLPQSKMINTSKKFKSEWIKLKNNVTHTHGKKGEHTHTGTAFTTWLNPQLAVQQALVVKNALVKLLPDYESEFTANFNSLKKDLLDLDQGLVKITQGKETLPLLASHPVYQYLQKRYSLNLRSVHWGLMKCLMKKIGKISRISSPIIKQNG